MGKIKNVIKNPKKIILFMATKGMFKWIPDKIYLKLVYKLKMNEKLDLNNPKTYNQKLQWLKLYNRNPMYTKLVDKYEVREYIKEQIGEEYLIPLLGVYDSFEEIDFDNMPNEFVIKCTHDSGGVIICKDKSKFDKDEARKKINKCLKKNYYYIWREWPYKHVKPRIICEKYMEDKISGELIDYKFMCFNGEPKLIQFHKNRSSNYTLDFFDIDWNKTSIVQGVPNSVDVISKPECLDDMLKIVRKVARDTNFIRIDLYFINNRIYFGEITYYPTSGFTPFENEEDDIKLGEWIKLT